MPPHFPIHTFVSNLSKIQEGIRIDTEQLAKNNRPAEAQELGWQLNEKLAAIIAVLSGTPGTDEIERAGRLASDVQASLKSDLAQTYFELDGTWAAGVLNTLRLMWPEISRTLNHQPRRSD